MRAGFEARAEYAPISRFSSTDMALNSCRPSGTSTSPRAALACGGSRVTSSPRNTMRPLQGRMLPTAARSVVVLPTPFAPTRVVSLPAAAASDTPHRTWTSS